MDFNNIFHFLIDLQFNNHRNWFQDNKNRYLSCHEDFLQFTQRVINGIAEFDENIRDVRAEDCVYRIYRDVRFSKNKEPYKNYFGSNIAQGGKNSAHSGYYIHLQPDQSFAGGGMFAPESAKLLALRTHIYQNIDTFKEIIQQEDFRTIFPTFYGEKLKLAPKGFSKDFPDIELLKYKHYIVTHDLDNDFWFEGNPEQKLVEIFKVQYQFNVFLDEALGNL